MHQITHMHLDSTTQKALKSLQAFKKGREDQKRKILKKAGDKKTNIPFNFYIVYFRVLK